MDMIDEEKGKTGIDEKKTDIVNNENKGLSKGSEIIGKLMGT